jgi:GT2 family glycosyltransferase
MWNDEKHFQSIKLIENKENVGFSKGNNISSGKNDYVCILNPDTVVAEDTFIKVLAFAKEEQN